MNIVDRYQQTVFETYLRSHPGADPERVKCLIQQLTDRNLKNIPCVMHNNMTKEKSNTSIIDVFDWVETRNPIITGNGTFFKQHAEYLSPAITMLETLQGNRDKKKKIMYKFDKKTVEYSNAHTAQNSIKTIMNSDYGGCATMMSPFFSMYIPSATTGSAKALTTTLICCLEMLSGNDNMWSKINHINELFDMINIILNDKESRNLIHDTYTVEEVTQRLLSMVNIVSINDTKVLKTFISTLLPEELTKLMLAFNVRLVLTRYLSTNVSVVMDYYKSNQVDLNNITKETLGVAGFGEKVPESIADEIDYIKEVVIDNCAYPFILNDNEVRAQNMKRLIVCVTDTDSLMVHFASYIKEFQSQANNFRDSCIFAAALGMRLFVEGLIPKMVSYIGLGCNINDNYYRSKFIFKNEFIFLAMTLFARKMYASSMLGQEGNPRDIHDIAITGLSFKKRDAAEFLEPIMLELYDKYILTSDNVRVDIIMNKFYELRGMLIEQITSKPKYFKVLTIKDIGAYDASKVLPAQMRGAIVWNNLMPDEEMLPMDRVTLIPLSFDLLQKNTHIPMVDEILRLTLIDNENMKTDPYICIPEYYKEIPDWIKPVIDIEVTVDKLLTPFKQLLGLFDVYTADTRGGMIPSRMIYL